MVVEVNPPDEWERYPRTGPIQEWKRGLPDRSELRVWPSGRAWRWVRQGPHRRAGVLEQHQEGQAPTAFMAKIAADNAARIHGRRPR